MGCCSNWVAVERARFVADKDYGSVGKFGFDILGIVGTCYGFGLIDACSKMEYIRCQSGLVVFE